MSETRNLRRTPFASDEALNKLLHAVGSLHPNLSLENVGQRLLQLGAELFDNQDLALRTISLESELIILRNGRAAISDSPVSDRVFCDSRYERVIPLPNDPGSALFIAHDDEERLIPAGAASFLDQYAYCLGAALRHARAHAERQCQSAQLHSLEAQLLHASKLAAVGQMTAMIVHEINNPLTTIVAYADQLKSKLLREKLEQTDAEKLSRIQEAAERVVYFASNLMSHARPSMEVPTAIAIDDIIDRALLFCEHVFEQGEVRVERRFAPEATVLGVRSQLTQVFVNLFTNAAHAMRPQGGCLRISCALRAVEKEVTIVIDDDGPGIAPEHIPRVFDPFFTTKNDGSGTGLGLSIVRRIIARHGGRIVIDPSCGRGAVFQLTLPLAESPTELQEAEG